MRQKKPSRVPGSCTAEARPRQVTRRRSLSMRQESGNQSGLTARVLSTHLQVVCLGMQVVWEAMAVALPDFPAPPTAAGKPDTGCVQRITPVPSAVPCGSRLEMLHACFGTSTPQCACLYEIMISIRWYSGYLQGVAGRCWQSAMLFHQLLLFCGRTSTHSRGSQVVTAFFEPPS